MNDIIEDLFKIYLSCLDSYNPKIYQVVNNKYTIIDKSMLTVYLYIKILEDRNEKNLEATNTLSNYLLKQIIFSETGNIALEISDKSKVLLYNETLDKLILEKFDYKNRIMVNLKYNYKNVKFNKYNELITFLEDIAEYSIFYKMFSIGNKEITPFLQSCNNKIINNFINIDDYFYDEKRKIVDLIKDSSFFQSQYGNLISIALNLKDVYRYSQITTQLPENVLFHQYTTAIMSLLISEYCNNVLNENIDIYSILVKSLFHDFGEYKGNEIITQFKNYNNITKKMFAEIEKKDEEDLKEKIGKNLYEIISNYHTDAEGFISEMMDKILGIMKLWVEVGYFNNNNFIKTINSVYQDRFKIFLKIENIYRLKNKDFYMNLLREYYIYIKEHLIEKDLQYFLKYFTEEELEQFRDELDYLKRNQSEFLKM